MSFPARKLETALTDPFAVWLSHLLRVEARATPAVADVLALRRGIWVHDWLKAALRALPPGDLHPHFPEALQRLLDHAQQDRERVERAYESAGLPVSDRWLGWWRESLSTAREFLETVASSGYRFVQAEGKIRSIVIRLASSEDQMLVDEPPDGQDELALHGQIDLILRRGDELVVVDYKTGSPKDVRKQRMALQKEGVGLQVYLYAAALQEREQQPVSFLLLYPGEDLDELISEREACPLVEAHLVQLARLERTGVLGPPIEGGMAPVPLAVLRLPKDLWASRFEATFGPGSATTADDDGEDA